MDLKGVVKTLVPPVTSQRREPVEKSIRSEHTNEREGNGQSSFGSGSGEQHGPMSDEQFKKAIEHLKSHAVVKENSLVVSVEDSEGRRFVLISEPSGKVVRRIPESELWSLQFTKDNEKGQLLSKAA